MKKLILLILLALLSINIAFAQRPRGKAEVFIQLAEHGNFKVYLDDELVGSATGRFRFYEVHNNKPILTILAGSEKVFSREITTVPNKRLVFNFSRRGGLTLLKELNMYRNNVYALDDFDGYVGAYNTGIVPPNRPTYPQNQNDFEDLVARVKQEAFDDQKLKVISAYSNYTILSTKQIGQLLPLFFKDESKLLLAKQEFQYVVDPHQFYLLKDSFTFMGTKDEFMKFLEGQKTEQVRNRPMSASDFDVFYKRFKSEAFDDNKTELAKVALINIKLTSEQVKELIACYSFEDKGLDFAKWAFRITFDKENYYSLADKFKFPSNKQSLLDFISKQK
ncbi:DUF4476 domain-containing protein [Pedobacter sp.]|uniref:DUF4476 domain-containing protein n=1 Tax=Pedobacter sp. TaxID=1411316 RepID=UPI0031D92FB1